MDDNNFIRISNSSDIQRIKYSSLIKAFQNFGFQLSKRLSQNEIRLFLNGNSSSGYFDPNLCTKLFHFLNFNENSTISIPEFIQGFLAFENSIKRNEETSRIKLAREREIYNNILKQCIAYQSEELNSEGFCKNAKIYGEITDIDIKQKLKGIKEIIICVIFNDKKEELHFQIGGENTNMKKTFEFRPTSRKDHFEFVMNGINDEGKVFNIGSKVFPLTDITSQEKYLVQIIVPEIDDPEKVAAYINATIVLYMSNYDYYDSLRKKQEKKINKYKIIANKSSEYLQNILDIYGDLSHISPDLIYNYNNQRDIQTRRIEIHNRSKHYPSPFIENRKMENFYQYRYNSPIIKSSYNKTEQHKSQYMQNSYKENINNIKLIQYNSPINNKNEFKQGKSKGIPLNLDKIKENKIIYLNDNLFQDKNQYSHRQFQSSYLGKILKRPNSETNILHNFQQNENKITQNTINPQYININQQNFDKTNIKQILNQEATKSTITTTNVQNNSEQVNTEIKGNANVNVKVNEENPSNETNNVTEVERASVYQIIGEISKKKTIMAETKILEPVVKNTVNMEHSISKALVTQVINKEIVQERTLPVSYLPEKVNKLIHINKIITLPVIYAGNKVIYKTLKPTIHEQPKVPAKEEQKKVININKIDFGNHIVNNNSSTNIINIVNTTKNNPETIMKNNNVNNSDINLNSNNENILRQFIKDNNFNNNMSNNSEINNIYKTGQITKISLPNKSQYNPDSFKIPFNQT